MSSNNAKHAQQLSYKEKLLKLISRSNINTLLDIISFMGIIIVLSSLDYKDELDNEDYYCKMVADGKWGAFNDIPCTDY